MIIRRCSQPTPELQSDARPVSDPMGGDLAVYRATTDELEREIRRVLDRIAAQRGSGPT